MGLLFIVALIGNVILSILPPQSIERLFDMSDSRTDIWGEAIKVFYKYPIIGGGMNAASAVTLRAMNIDSHNVYLDILCGSGVVGAFLFIAFFVMNCMKCKKSDRATHFCLIVVFMLPMAFINGFNTATFYVPLVLLAILSDFSRRNDGVSAF